MTQELADYIEAGKALDVDERLEAARQLLLSVDHDPHVAQDRIDSEWDEVVDRRVGEILDGTARMVDGREGIAEIRRALAARRQ